MAISEGVQTLDELKAENAEEEKEIAESPQDEAEELEPEAVEDEPEESDEVAEPAEDDPEEPKIESWMDDGHTSDGAKKKFTDGDVGKAKTKLRAKLERKHDEETEKLKARISELEGKPSQPGELSRPKREDFENADDPEEAYIEALTDYKITKSEAKVNAKRASDEADNRQRQIKQETDSAVEKHYEAAAKLAEDSGISAEAYQGADLQVRQMIDSIFPGSGDVVADAFIAKLGEGSEKVFYSIGVNAERRAKFKQHLQDDTSGIAAGMYLGELKKDLTAPSKRKTAAPAPGKNLKGDTIGKSEKSQKRAYDKAHETNDLSKAFTLKMEAKKAGVDTSTW